MRPDADPTATLATTPERTMTHTVEGLRLDRHTPLDLSPAAIVDVLRRISFLAPVPEDMLLDLVERVPLHRCPAGGQVLMRQGEYGHSLFILLTGAVVVEATTGGDQVEEIARVTAPGSTFGEGAVLGRRRRSATVRTLGPSILLEIDKTSVEQLDLRTNGLVQAPLEVLAELRALSAFVEQHRFFALMSVESRRTIKAHARLNTYRRGQTVFRRGEPAGTVYIVKTGTAELVSPSPEGGSSRPVVNYLSVGDAVGLVGRSTQVYDLVSRGYLELFELDSRHLLGLPEADRDVLRRFHKDAVDLPPVLSPGGSDGEQTTNLTVELFQAGMIADGAQEGLSLLTIDLDACIRCGNCVRACQSRHGRARFTRQGEKLVRRQGGQDKSRHQAVLLPSSCRHCVDPVCMIDCPTGAIHRTARGEVVIEDTCIGCASCANRCPWGNITMAETPERLVDGTLRPHKAHKCDLCAGYDEPNCVHNCPTGAILRVEPTSFYPELRAVLGRTGQTALPRTAGEQAESAVPRRRSRWAANAAGLLGALVVGLSLFAAAPSPYSPWSWPGLALGGLTLGCMIGAMMLAVRRRRAGARKPRPDASRLGRYLSGQWGSFLGWARLHVGLGACAGIFLVLHCAGRPGGALTASLLWLSLAEVALGIFGVIYSRWMPRVITRLEGPAQLEEDVRAEWSLRRQHLARGLETLDADKRAVFARVAGRAGGRLRRLWRHVPYGFGGRIRDRQSMGSGQSVSRRPAPRVATERAAFYQGELRRLSKGFTAADYPVLDRLVDEHVRLVDLGACLWLYHVRQTWLGLHIAIAGLVCVLVVAHVGSVSTFLLGGGP